MQEFTTQRDSVRTLLHNRPATLTFEKIASETTLTVSWLRAFSRGAAKNPGVCTIEELTTYLKNYK